MCREQSGTDLAFIDDIARRDPLRLSLMRFLACTLFYIPALRRLADDLTDEAEIEADALRQDQ